MATPKKDAAPAAAPPAPSDPTAPPKDAQDDLKDRVAQLADALERKTNECKSQADIIRRQGEEISKLRERIGTMEVAAANRRSKHPSFPCFRYSRNPQTNEVESEQLASEDALNELITADPTREWVDSPAKC